MLLGQLRYDQSELTNGGASLGILFRNRELNLLLPGSGCPLQAGTGYGRPGRVDADVR